MAISNRLKVNAALNSFTKEIERLKKFDASNQKKFANGELSKAQNELLIESIFFYGFRSYESFVREIFLLYCLEKQPSKRKRVRSFLKARDFQHTEELIKSSMPFLDWSSPTTVIDRAEIYLHEGYPIKLPFTTNKTVLGDFKKIRNHIAHNSIESQADFNKVVKNFNGGILPLVIPSPGQYLLLTSKKNRNNYILLDFFDLMTTLSRDLT